MLYVVITRRAGGLGVVTARDATDKEFVIERLYEEEKRAGLR